MRRDHESSLNAALDQLYLQGSTAILWEHLYLWYNVQRLNRNVYRDLIERWQRLCEEYGHSEREIPELECLDPTSPTWLLLFRGVMEGEKRIPLADLT